VEDPVSPLAAWAERCRQHELGYQEDPAGGAVFPPRFGLPWRTSAGLGEVYATTTVRRRDEEPYDISLISLDEGFRMMSRVEGVAPGGGPDRPARARRVDRGRPADAGVPTGMTGLAVVGAAESDLGEVGAGTTPADLMAQASHRALADCGLGLDDVDGVFAATTQLPMASLSLAEALGLRPRYTDSTQIGGSSPLAHLDHARAAIAARRCAVALIAYGSTQRSVGRATTSVQEVSPWEAPFRPRLPVAAYALAARRHMHEFGTTPEQLAEVAVAARAWARGNPRARSRDPLTVRDVLDAPRVCDPLGVRDCCLVTDGGGALVVCAAERARRLRQPPVHVLGVAVEHSHRHITAMPDLVRTAAVESGRRAFAEAGLGPDDVAACQLYDAFTITPILFLEDLGFCAKGEGGAFVSGGRIAPGGLLPVNTNGGGLSYGHPGMYGLLLLVEAVRRVRAGDDVVLAHGNGGVLSSQATAVLGSEATV
jgi:acetyl-CoA acetyltransferase